MKYVISLGGSVINSGKIDSRFLNKFASLIKTQISSGDKFYIITGGGGIARKRIDSAKRAGVKDQAKLDWLGIEASWENAKELQSVLEKKKVKDVFVFGGEKPGQSTDTVAVKIAKKYRVKTVLNLSNIDFVFTSDPRKNKNAKKIEQITNKDFLKLVGEKFVPGGNYPFDPIATKLAQKEKIKIVVMNGRKLANLKKLFQGKSIKGTVIK